jgi:hypothetical protein
MQRVKALTDRRTVWGLGLHFVLLGVSRLDRDGFCDDAMTVNRLTLETVLPVPVYNFITRFPFQDSHRRLRTQLLLQQHYAASVCMYNIMCLGLAFTSALTNRKVVESVRVYG